ncbi:MAG: ankyrin repeat domain-containing protein [Synergistaceae bacterium]|nr:ankyrin repeat domain-containing protein [Synergistaceae bacterium]
MFKRIIFITIIPSLLACPVVTQRASAEDTPAPSTSTGKISDGLFNELLELMDDETFSDDLSMPAEEKKSQESQEKETTPTPAPAENTTPKTSDSLSNELDELMDDDYQLDTPTTSEEIKETPEVKPEESAPEAPKETPEVKPEEPAPEAPKETPEVKPEENKPVSQISPEEFRRLCASSSLEMISNALENRNADVNAIDYYDTTPLMFAAEKNSDPEVINALIKFGADPNAKDKDNKTPLMFAAAANTSPEIITALAKGGANVNARDSNRMTPLMYAARNNNAAVVKALIEAGAEELADKRGWTPLFWAARYTNDPEVIGVLLDAGHDPLVRAHDMATPIDHANRNKKLMNTKEFLRLEEASR